jgi:hypothetical protein
MKVWFEDPQQLFRADKISQFWPTSEQTPEDRINAASRFVIYASCMIYLIRRDPRIFVLGATVLSVIYVLYKSKMVTATMGYTTDGEKPCQVPTEENPMANVLITDFTDAPNRLEACYYPTVKSYTNKYTSGNLPVDGGRSRSPLPKYMRNAVDRQFVTNPVSKIPGDQTAFAEWLYGPKNGPLCRSDTRYCDPNARGVQLEAFSGLGTNGDKRSGMFAR